jgi:hypothetical protein
MRPILGGFAAATKISTPNSKRKAPAATIGGGRKK